MKCPTISFASASQCWLQAPKANLMITKGALAQVLDVCTSAEMSDGTERPLADVREDIDARFAAYSTNGQRTLGLARRKLGPQATIGMADEAGMCFIGFLLFSDPLKPGIAATIEQLKALGVSLKVITGDNALIAAAVGRQIGFADAEVLSGAEMKMMSDGALLNRVSEVNIFAEIEPNEKERIIRALRKAGNVVGYMGDGINDASALHAADVGLSVESAVDVAKEVADIVLMEKDLNVLIDGVREGRVTFANTLKYGPGRDQRQLRQHVQHGRCFVAAAVPATVAQADPADEHAHRSAGHDDIRRWRR